MHQRKVSLIIADQGGGLDTGKDVSQNNGNKSDSDTKLEMGNERSFFNRNYREAQGHALNLKPVKMNHNHSMWCSNDVVNRSHMPASLEAKDKPEREDERHPDFVTRNNSLEVHPRRISFDDIDLYTLPPRLEHKGTIPMVGSLVYYRRKASVDKGHDPESTDVPLPHEAAAPAGSDSETAVTDESSDSDSMSRSSVPNYKLYRHFSSPQISYDRHDPGDDEFNMINSKIDSQIKMHSNNFNKAVRDEHRRSHYEKVHYPIPGLDPELSPYHSDANSNATSNTQLSQQPSSSTRLNFAATPRSQEPQNTRNSRHRRRLTCAMIFTRPKVVEI